MAVNEEYGALCVRTSRAVSEPNRWRRVDLCLLLLPRIIAGSSCHFSNVYNSARGWRRQYGWVSSYFFSRMARTSCPVKQSLEDHSDVLVLGCFYHFSRCITTLNCISANCLPSVCGRRRAKLNAWWRAAGASRRPHTFTKGKLCHCYKYSAKGASSGLS